MAVWLITWEPASPSVLIPEKERVVGMLNYRWKAENVKKIVAMLYARAQTSLEDQLAVARMLKQQPASVYVFYNGFQGQIMTHGNPFLYARLVDNPRVVGEADNGRLIWDERPYPEAVSKLRRTVQEQSSSRGAAVEKLNHLKC